MSDIKKDWNMFSFMNLRFSKVLLSLLVCLLLIAALCWSFSRLGWEPARPIIRVDQPHLSLGDVIPGETRSVDYRVWNSGRARLTIGQLQWTCGCFNASVDKAALEPGEATALRVNFKAPLDPGQFAHDITFATNDPSHSIARLTFHGMAQWPVDIEPSSIHFSAERASDLRPAELQLFSATRTDFTLKAVIPSEKWIRVEQDPTPPSSHSKRLFVSVAPDLPQGSYRGTIQLETSEQTRPTLVVAVACEVTPASRVSPKRLMLKPSRAGSLIPVNFLLSRAGQEAQQRVLQGVEALGEGWSVLSWQIADEGSEVTLCKIQLRVPSRTGYSRSNLRFRFGPDAEIEEVQVSGLMIGTPEAHGPEERPPHSGIQGGSDQSLAEKFAALKRRYEAREKAFHDALAAANKLAPEVRSKKIADENRSFKRDWFALAEEVRALIRAHPADPAALEGIILLPGPMRSFLDDDLVKIVRDHFMDDPRMGRLCAALASRTENWSRGILRDVAVDHPDRAVRAQATYSLGMWWRYSAESKTPGHDRIESDKEQRLAEARRLFTRVTQEYADVVSADGSFRLADRAHAELARIANLPNLKVGQVAPEIAGEDLDGNSLKLSDHRGKIVVICFWATWCGPCMAMVPHERRLVERMEGKPFTLLGVNCDEAGDREKARETTRLKHMTWPSWWDGGSRGAIQSAYNVDHWPTVYVLDSQGVIRYVDIQGEELDRAVDALLAEMTADPKVEAAK